MALNPNDDRGERSEKTRYISDRSKDDMKLAYVTRTIRSRANMSPCTPTVLWHDKSPKPLSGVGYMLARIWFVSLHRVLNLAPCLSGPNHPSSVLHLRATDDRRTGTCADLECERQKNRTDSPKYSLLLYSLNVPADSPPCNPPLKAVRRLRRRFA